MRQDTGAGQVSLGPTIVKGNARKVRRLGRGSVIGRLRRHHRPRLHAVSTHLPSSGPCRSTGAEPTEKRVGRFITAQASRQASQVL